MEQLQQLTNPNTRISRNIRFRAARLARSGAVPGLDADDIEQELRLDLIRRAGRFDPAKSSFDTFADRIITNRIATLASSTKAMRAERAMQSIHAPVGDEDGGLALADTQMAQVFGGMMFGQRIVVPFYFGKVTFNAVSCGAADAAYSDGGANGADLRTLLAPFEKTAEC